MSNKKNIDRLFQEKFKDFEVTPNDAVWSRISDSLPNTKKKRRVLPLWFQIGGVAAVIALLLTVGVSVFNSNESQIQDLPIVNTDNDLDDTEKDDVKDNTNSKQEQLDKDNETIRMVDSEKDATLEEETSATKEKTISNQLLAPNTSQNNAIANNPVRKEETSTAQKQDKIQTTVLNEKNSNVAANTESGKEASKNLKNSTLASESEMKAAIDKTLENKNSAVANNETNEKKESENGSAENTENSETDTSLTDANEKQSIEDAIAAQNSEEPLIEKEEDKQSRWSIAPNVAPVYFSSLGKGSSLDKQFNENSKSSDINMSYGVAGTYAISKKLKVRAGLNRVDLSQTTSDVYAFSGAETALRGVDAQFKNISFNNRVQSVSLMSSKMLNRASVPELFITKVAGNVEQRFGFIEIPLELEYKVLDNKFGVNVIGGFSTLFLNNNEIYADIDGSSTLIGKANNINGTSFSANFGLGMDYNLSQQWNINFEPTLKYQLNTFNNTSGDFRPFFIGVYTGLSFKF